MAGTFQAEVNTGQLLGGAQTVVSLTQVASDPAAAASTGQVYAKTDNNLYYENPAGTIVNLLTPTQAASNALGPNTVAWPYGAANFTGPNLLNGGSGGAPLKGIVAHLPGSIVGAFCIGNAGTAYSGNLVVYKNNASFFTALTAIVMQTTQGLGVPKYASFLNGSYPFAAGDALDCYVTHSGSSMYIGAGLIVNFGNITASGLSTTLAANTTVAATDNQRVWQASAATQYVLTLPATNSAQDFYVRVVVTGGAGVKVQAPSGVLIYNGTSTSSSGGTLTATAAGAYATLYNPAGTSLWTMTDPSTLWTTA